jgi:hypothetical protein
VVIGGGASLISEEDLQRLQRLFSKVLAPLAQELGVIVADGGTDAGVMRLMGQRRGSRQFSIGGGFSCWFGEVARC